MYETHLIYQVDSLSTEPSMIYYASSLNNVALQDCHEARSRRLNEASEIEAGHHSEDRLHGLKMEAGWIERASALTLCHLLIPESLYFA